MAKAAATLKTPVAVVAVLCEAWPFLAIITRAEKYVAGKYVSVCLFRGGYQQRT